jgi:hypothetical protein
LPSRLTHWSGVITAWEICFSPLNNPLERRKNPRGFLGSSFRAQREKKGVITAAELEMADFIKPLARAG